MIKGNWKGLPGVTTLANEVINMARPVDPNSIYRVSVHNTNGYSYACTQPSVIDDKTGKKKYHYVHWGRVNDENKFIPGKNYIYASHEERERLIFPDTWDLSETEKLSGAKNAGRPPYEGEDANRLYGDIWLFEQIASKTQVRQDLLKVFDKNKELVDDIMTLAMFPYLTNYSYNRVVRCR